MADEDAVLTALRPDLFQDKAGLFLAPIRHHSPACAWAVRAMIREVRPRHVLIEAPVDFHPLIHLLLNEETVPPVAIVSLVEQKDAGRRVAAHYPFCQHSPEFVAMQAAREVGAEIAFIDLPAADKMLMKQQDGNEPVVLSDDHHFGSGRYIEALCREYRCRDGFELWDQLFESRLGQEDWRGFFTSVGAYCAGLRAATPPGRIEADGDAAREAHMSAEIVRPLASGPVVAVVGGFHAPALAQLEPARPTPPPEKRPTSEAYLIRYSFQALDALNGYSAGLPQPGYYQELWQRAEAAGGPPDWRATSLELCANFASEMREAGHQVTLPALVELLRSAETLALMRGHPGAMRHDLFDAVRSALVKGEVARRDAWSERFAAFLSGTAIGDIPQSAGSPPLVEDARAQARKNRIDISDSSRRRRRLDIHRNPAHRQASQFFHAMSLLSTGFAAWDAGPDFLNQVNTDRLFEEWSHAWSPRVESRLIELSPRGDQVGEVCLSEILHLRELQFAEGGGQNLAFLIDLMSQGILAGLGESLLPFARQIAADIQAHSSFVSVGAAFEKVFYISQSSGPIGAPESLDLSGLAQACYRRMVYLCDSLKQVREEDRAQSLEALRLVADLLNGDAAEILDRELFDDAIERLAAADIQGDILGGVLAIAVQTGRRGEGDLLAALSGNLNGVSTSLEDRLGVLRGLLMTAPALLWQGDHMLDAVDGFLSTLDEPEFVELLPHLRLAFAALNPREVDLLAGLLSRLHGGTVRDFTSTSHSVTEQELQAGLWLDQQVRAGIACDGLQAWLLGEEGPA